MSLPQTTSTRPATGLRALPGRLLGTLIVLGVGLLIGTQYAVPQRRIIAVLAGLAVAGLAWRFSLLAGLGLLILALPFPRGTVFGNTNLALILILTVIWLLRVSQRQVAAPQRTGMEWPLAGLVIMYVLSFWNVHDKVFLAHGLENFEVFLAAVLMFYLIVNNVRTNRDLERLHQFMMVSALSLFAIALWELNHPGQEFLRGWISFSSTAGTEFDTRNVRIGSMFHDFELLSEYCALTMLLAWFQLARARSLGRKTFVLVFLAINVFVLFATVTRGAFIALAPAVLYALWYTRRRLRFVPLTIVAVGAVVGFLIMNYYVSHFTRSGDIIARLTETHFEHGWIPDSRATAWPNAFGRALVHPLIGAGPAFAHIPGWEDFWPHNLYLYYANIVGFIGLGFFLWLMWSCFRATKPLTDDLSHPDYARAYLLICRLQMVVFLVNEIKIEYLRNNVYMFQVWVMISVWVATHEIARRNAAPRLVAVPVPAPPTARARRAAGA